MLVVGGEIIYEQKVMNILKVVLTSKVLVEVKGQGAHIYVYIGPGAQSKEEPLLG